MMIIQRPSSKQLHLYSGKQRRKEDGCVCKQAISEWRRVVVVGVCLFVGWFVCPSLDRSVGWLIDY